MEINKIYNMDCLEGLKLLPDNSINSCITSPPYFNLRNYNIDGQIGVEETPKEFINKLVEVFREVRRVLKDDGTIWIVIGDSYNGSGGNHTEFHKNDSGFQGKVGAKYGGKPTKIEGLKPKDLIGIPWMLAFALRDDGWYLRQEIIFSKNNPMPESVKDRCTRAHETIFMLSKNQKYHYDQDSIREPMVTKIQKRNTKKAPSDEGTERSDRKPSMSYKYDGVAPGNPLGKNKRDVWQLNTKPYKGAHFATFSEELVTPMILAGCPENGIVLDPFAGSGTTCAVAKKNNRNYIGIELNPDYVKIAEDRIKGFDC